MTRRTTSQSTGRNRLITTAVRRAILIAGVLAAGVSARTETASAQAYSADLATQDRYLQSVEAATASNDAPVVLRGSRPAPQTSAEEGNACPAGSIEEPGSGCVSPGYAGEPYGDGYWPYFSFDGGFAGIRRHELRRRFARHEFVDRLAGVRAIPIVRFHGFPGTAQVNRIGHR